LNLQQLFTMQRQLDQHIEDKHELHKEDLIPRKLLALLVEIGELANETRCFKFWSVKPPAEVSSYRSIQHQSAHDRRQRVPRHDQPWQVHAQADEHCRTVQSEEKRGGHAEQDLQSEERGETEKYAEGKGGGRPSRRLRAPRQLLDDSTPVHRAAAPRARSAA